MPLGTGLFLIAVGAILRFGVSVHTKGFNLHTVGIILMIVGAVGVVLALFWMTVWSSRRDRYPHEYPRDDRYVDEPPPRTR